MLPVMRVHSTLPDALARAADAELRAAGLDHVAHGTADPVNAAAEAAADPQALALLGPYRSAEVAEAGVQQARRAAELVIRALTEGANERATLLAAIRRLGSFDAHGDPHDPPVWLWRAGAAWRLHPDRPL